MSLHTVFLSIISGDALFSVDIMKMMCLLFQPYVNISFLYFLMSCVDISFLYFLAMRC
jgi:hypothetical protein